MIHQAHLPHRRQHAGTIDALRPSTPDRSTDSYQRSEEDPRTCSTGDRAKGRVPASSRVLKGRAMAETLSGSPPKKPPRYTLELSLIRLLQQPGRDQDKTTSRLALIERPLKESN